ncbi:MAG: T9SS type A sorting domain-containing protein [Bacteroidales bacterium]|nr:T9SS type A sorting domain-containing protein [Bacteroidales bacterium]
MMETIRKRAGSNEQELQLKRGLGSVRSVRTAGNLFMIFLMIFQFFSFDTFSQRRMEFLTRGLVAVKSSEQVFLSWRLFAADTGNIEFNIYRNGTPITQTPVSGISNLIDSGGTTGNIYYLETLRNGERSEISTPVTVWENNFITIPLRTPDGYTPNDASVADLNGDGEYEIIIKMERTTHDNAHSGYTDPVFLHAYNMNGTFLWSINLGINIRGGAHYTQFMVYDLNGDGKAEVACKTAPGTTDGTGTFLSNGPAATDDDAADYRNAGGFILSGPEYLTVFEGMTGKELSTVDYIPLRAEPYPLYTWGDTDGNRVDRFLACVAYYDTIPSLVMCRGYYDRTTLTAWDFINGQLVKRWAFDTEDDQAALKQYEEQGAHSIAVGDVDYDGKDEIIYGAMAFDDDGTPLYNTRFNHGDATHLGDLIPSRPGLEFYMPSETAGRVHDGVTNPAVHARDAATGEILLSVMARGDIGRAMTADITADHPGNEFWASGLSVYNSNGDIISNLLPPINFAAWWDGDLLREMLDGNKVSKWGVTEPLLVADGCTSNNGTKSTPALSGDILGDWREEVIFRTTDNQSLRIYTTTIPTPYGIYTLLQDPVYRQALVWQNVAYNQPPHPGFFIGHDMQTPPVPDIKVMEADSSPVINIRSPKEGYELNLGLDLNVIVRAVSLADTNQTIILYDNDSIILDTLLFPPYMAFIPDLKTGEHTLKASAFDKNGNLMISGPVTFSVDEGHPHIAITSPVNNSIFQLDDTITVTAKAFDTDGSIDSVAFFINKVWFASVSESPYTIKIANPEIGIYEMTAIAYDNTSKETVSEAVRSEVGSICIMQENETGFCGFANGIGYIESNHPGHTGSGFANTDNVQGVQIVWALNIPETGDYKLIWKYAATSVRPGILYINDTLIGNVGFGNTGEWTNWDEAAMTAVNITAGLKKIALEAAGSSGLPNIDYLEVISLTSGESVASADCDSLPSVSAIDAAKINEYQNMFDLFPVPAGNHIEIKLIDQTENIDNLSIYRIDGSKVMTLNSINMNRTRIEIPGLKNGIYLIQLNTNYNSYTGKFNIIK